MSIIFCTFGCLFLGYTYAGYGKNLYTRGYRKGKQQAYDYPLLCVQGFAQNEKRQYAEHHSKLLKELIMEKKGDADVLDWVVFGKHYSKNGEEELAFQCFYMAHLIDHKRFGTNSKLPFDTLEQP